jgi:hypothetical protein
MAVFLHKWTDQTPGIRLLTNIHISIRGESIKTITVKALAK